MIIHPPSPVRRFPKRKPVGPVAAPVALTLVAASVDDGPTLTMQFNVAIDVSAMDVSTCLVADSGQGFNYVGFGSPVLLDANTVQVQLTGTSEYDGPDTTLTAGDANGIAGAAGGAWGGCDGVELPFSS
jgi:hypothetical protein